MKVLFLIVTLFIFSSTEPPKFVLEYHQLSGKKEEIAFINKYKENKNISVKAYVISLQMKQAKYRTMPWSKLKIFKKGKKSLERLIEKYPNNVHLRYVRLVIQEQTPGILGYKSAIKTDKAFLKNIMHQKDSTQYLNPFIIKNTSL